MQFHCVSNPILSDSLKCLHIIPISDTHIGDENFSEARLKETLYTAKQLNALILLVGDIINNGIKSSVTNCYCEVMRPSEQVKYAVSLFEPHKDRIIGAISGNHERRSDKEVDCSPAERYAEKLGVPYFGDEVLLKLRFGKSSAEGDPIIYSMYATHGASGGRTVGGKVNSLSQKGDIVVADVICQGHTHQLSCHTESIFLPDLRQGKVNQQKMMYVSTGGYLARGGYAAQKGYAPLELGSPLIELSGKRKDVRVTI